jgi:riboflavin kinase/FMN adenylyltransferase
MDSEIRDPQSEIRHRKSRSRSRDGGMKHRERDSASPTRVVGDLNEAARMVGNNRTVCCVGVFDGVHLGHQRLIQAAVAEAARRRCRSVVITFQNHPLSILAPAYAPLLLTDVEEKVKQIAALRPSLIAAILFDRDLADLEPEAFVEETLAKQLYVVSIWCGSDFRFGRQGRGDLTLLAQQGRRVGIEVRTIDPVYQREHLVSSTWIRTLIEHGKVEQAAECLGRNYVIRGPVVSGHGRGRTLGFPTANIAAPAGIVLPADGIYAVRTDVGSRLYGGMINVGPAPTFGVVERRLEVHLFDYKGELAGKSLGVHFVSRLRDVIRFDSAEQLILQMKDDEQRARSVLKQVSDKENPAK